MKAFTLAEVLITIAVIGIVAALTIPNLVYAYKKKIIETRIVNFVSNMSNALKLSTIDNGDIATWNMGSNDNHRNSEFMEAWFNQYLKPYMKNLKTSTKVSDVTTPENPEGNGIFDIYLNDGSVIRIEHMRNYDVGFFYYPYMSEKVQKFKTFGTAGVDYFYFVIMKDLSDGALNAYYRTYSFKNYTREDWLDSCTNLSAAAACTMLIEFSGWKIPKDYPHKL